MSISSRITEMEQHIGNAYDKIEDLGIDLTDVDKNINNISSMLENIWEEYPKVSATDVEEASLNGTKKGRINIDLKGNTEQDTLTGKNLFKKIPNDTKGGIELTQLENGIKLNGTSNASNYKSFPFESDIVLPAGTYTIYYKTTKVPINLGLYGENYSNIYDINISSNLENVFTMTLTEEKTIKGFRTWIDNGTTFNNEFLQIMILEGNVSLSNALPYEPYCGGIPSPNPDYPQAIKNVTGNANVKIQNKNLVNNDFTKWTNDTYAYIPIQLKQGQAYTLSAERVGELKTKYYNFGIVKDGTSYPFVGFNPIIDYTSGNPLSDYTFTPDDTWVNPKLVCYIANSETRFNELFQNYNIQLEQGTTATTYVPHQEQNYPFTFAEGQRAMQGTTLQDDGIHNAWGEIVLDGTENWSVFAREGFYTYYINIAKGKGYTALCNYFKNETTIIITQIPSVNCFKFNGETNKNVIFNRGDTENKLKNWKDYLAEQYANGTPVKVQYKLQQEKITPYNATQQSQYNAIKQAKSYDDQTNISQTNDNLPFILDIEALKNN